MPDQVVHRPAPSARAFGRAHLIVFAALFLPTVAHTTVALLRMSEADRRDVLMPVAPFLYAFGPFAGTIVRGWRNSRPVEAAVLGCFPAAILAAAAAAQFIIPPAGRGARAARLALWAVGVLAWFGSSWLSVMLAVG